MMSSEAEREQFINNYIQIHAPLRHRSPAQYGADVRLVKELRNVECYHLIDPTHKKPFDPNRDYQREEWEKTVEPTLRKEAIAVWNAEQDEKRRAVTESNRLTKENIIAINEETGQMLQWHDLIGVKTVETLVFEQLDVVNMDAVRNPQRFIDDLKRFNNRVVNVKSLNKEARILLRLRFPPRE
jgi:hypothetical protein